MKKFIPGILSFAILAVGGFALFQRLQPSLEMETAAVRVMPAVPEDEAALQLPPVASTDGEFPHINLDRLEKLAGEGYKGPAYAMTTEEFNQMVAENQAARPNGNRLPANTLPEEKKKSPNDR